MRPWKPPSDADPLAAGGDVAAPTGVSTRRRRCLLLNHGHTPTHTDAVGPSSPKPVAHFLSVWVRVCLWLKRSASPPTLGGRREGSASHVCLFRKPHGRSAAKGPGW